MSSLVLAVAVSFVTAPASIFAAGFLEAVESIFMQGLALLEAGYQRAPALMLVLSALLVLPMVALVSFTLQKSVRGKANRAALRAAQRRAQAGGDWTREGLSGTTIAGLAVAGVAHDRRWTRRYGAARGPDHPHRTARGQ